MQEVPILFFFTKVTEVTHHNRTLYSVFSICNNTESVNSLCWSVKRKNNHMQHLKTFGLAREVTSNELDYRTVVLDHSNLQRSFFSEASHGTRKLFFSLRLWVSSCKNDECRSFCGIVEHRITVLQSVPDLRSITVNNSVWLIAP